MNLGFSADASSKRRAARWRLDHPSDASTLECNHAIRRGIDWILDDLDGAIRDCCRLSDATLVRMLRQYFPYLHDRSQRNASLRKILAAICVSVERHCGKMLYETQLRAGLTMVSGSIAEMQTGEGKTLAGLIPTVVQGLSRRGVHVVLPNTYLAERDFQLLSPILRGLGLTSGIVREPDAAYDAQLQRQRTRNAYLCDVTYAASHCLGFDFLRDASERDDVRERRPSAGPFRSRMRGRNVAIIDEIDHVLVDDASSPLVLSQASAVGDSTPTQQQLTVLHNAAHAYASGLDSSDVHHDKSRGKWTLTDSAVDAAYTFLNRFVPADVRHVQQRPWHQTIESAVSAIRSIRRDVHYVVVDGAVQIIDQSTGRIFHGRQWNGGLHQCVETKEGVALSPPMHSVAQTSRSDFFGGYRAVCGMSGTLSDCSKELKDVYGLQVVGIAPRLPCSRSLLPDCFYSDLECLLRGVVLNVQERAGRGQPILIGTHAVETSHAVSRYLHDAGVVHHLLNGLQDAAEAEIVSRAGESGRVTVATNMAGRGTDIQLEQKSRLAGGLHVIAVNHHSLYRVDRQLVGRAARGGDPGSAQFFVHPHCTWLMRTAPWLCEQIQQFATELGVADASSRHQSLVSAIRREQADQETAAAALRSTQRIRNAEFHRQMNRELRHRYAIDTGPAKPTFQQTIN